MQDALMAENPDFAQGQTSGELWETVQTQELVQSFQNIPVKPE
jgi:hypothetical protein